MKTAAEKSKTQVLIENLWLWANFSCLFNGWLRIENVLAGWARCSSILKWLLRERSAWNAGSLIYQGFWALVFGVWQLGCRAMFGLLVILRKIFPSAVINDSWVGLITTGLFRKPGLILVATVFLLPLAPTKISLGMLVLFSISVLVYFVLNSQSLGQQRMEWTERVGRIEQTQPKGLTGQTPQPPQTQRSQWNWKARLEAFRQAWETPFDLPIILFIVILTIAVGLSISPKQSLITGLLYLLFIAFFYLVSWVLGREEHAGTLKLVIWSLMLSSLFLSFIGFYQFIVGVPVEQSWVDEKMFTGLQSRVFATLDNPNVLAEFLVFTIPLSLAALLSSRHLPTQVFITGIIGVSVLCLGLTYSRGGWLGFAMAMLVFFLLKDRRALFMLLLFGAVGIFFLPESILERVASIGNLQESSTAYRLSIWTASLRIIADYWVSGIGPGLPTFAMVYPYFSLAAGMAYHSHNLFLQLVVEMGFMGLAAFLWMMWVFVRAGIQSWRKIQDPYLKNILIGLIAGMAGYLLQGMTDYVWYSPRLILTFWLMLALMAALVRQAKRQT